MIKNKRLMFAATLISTSIILSGCSQTSETGVAKSNANQSQTLSNAGNIAVNNNVSAALPNAVPSVANPNTTPPTAANKQKPAASSVNEPKPQIGKGGDDFSMFTQVRGALNADKEFVDAVIVEIKEGNVTLSGNVSSQEQKTKAGQLAQGVAGVKSVKNNLRVSS